MAKDYSRADRVAQQLKRDLASLIHGELDHPKASLVTVTDVEVSRDYSHAKVFWTFLGDEPTRDELADTLERAKGFLRSNLARGIKLYKMPELHFHYDHSIEGGMRLDRLIDEANATRAKDDE